MALIRCPECGKVIGDIEVCPFCGVNVEEKEELDAQAERELQQKLREQAREAEQRKKLAQETAEKYREQYGDTSIPGTGRHVPRRPTCGSTNAQQISAVGRVASTAAWGLASKKINKTFKCNDCEYTW